MPHSPRRRALRRRLLLAGIGLSLGAVLAGAWYLPIYVFPEFTARHSPFLWQVMDVWFRHPPGSQVQMAAADRLSYWQPDGQEVIDCFISQGWLRYGEDGRNEMFTLEPDESAYGSYHGTIWIDEHLELIKPDPDAARLDFLLRAPPELRRMYYLYQVGEDGGYQRKTFRVRRGVVIKRPPPDTWVAIVERVAEDARDGSPALCAAAIRWLVKYGKLDQLKRVPVGAFIRGMDYAWTAEISCRVLLDYPGDRGDAALLAALRGDDRYRRLDVIHALEYRDVNRPEFAEALVDLAIDEHGKVLDRDAFNKLAQHCRISLPRTRRFLRYLDRGDFGEDDYSFDYLCRLIGRCCLNNNADNHRVLDSWLRSGDPVRASKAWAVFTGDSCVPCGLYLAGLLGDPNPRVRLWACWKATGWEEDSWGLVEPLQRLVTNETGQLRQQAIRALKTFGREAAPALPELRFLAASDPDPITRSHAATAAESIEVACRYGLDKRR